MQTTIKTKTTIKTGTEPKNPKTPTTQKPKKPKLQKTLIYQLYPASWGSLKAMQDFLPKIKALDVDYVWLSPIFPSPWVDGGYDVSDYRAINPRFGTMQDFDAFVAQAHKLGLKVLLDLVLNHTSTEHEWFKKSRQNDSEYKDYYLWSRYDLHWDNLFNGGRAFEYCEEREEYYLHLFDTTQADLNWENPAVIAEFQEIIDFWTEEHAVDGFRLDVCQFLSKNLRPAILKKPITIGPAGFLNYFAKPGAVQVLHQLFDHRNLFTIGEAGSLLRRDLKKFTQSHGGPLTKIFNTAIPESIDTIASFKATKIDRKRFSRLFSHFETMADYVLALESHDTPRFTSRARRSGKSILKFMFNADVQAICLYQGQELGLKNPKLPLKISAFNDRQTILQYEKALQKGEHPKSALARLRPRSRDNARQALNLEDYARQEADPNSCLTLTKRLISQWKNCSFFDN
ncbi:hypothetical protein IKF15_03010 [Candidatus Saccharibacteria bacterium]|nr:hypothetical protein [Candidatus Saccharibacteria bacterium]